MKNKSVSVVPLIQYWEQFIAEGNPDSMSHFAVWLQDRISPGVSRKTKETAVTDYMQRTTSATGNRYQSSLAAYHIGRMYKYVRFYTKDIITEHGLSAMDEFGILAVLDQRKETTKRHIIEEMMLETTTGTDMIRRLINLGLIREKINKTDRRERIISLTALGRTTLYRLYGAFTAIPDVLGDLNERDRTVLIQQLERLDHFHQTQWKALQGID